MSAPLRIIHIAVRDPAHRVHQEHSVEAYLWDGWHIAPHTGGAHTIVISGHDVAGWTAEALVERLATGLHFGEAVR